jgi:hypothetical protein
MNKGLVGAVGALVFAVGLATSAQAAEFILVDGGATEHLPFLNLDGANKNNATSDTFSAGAITVTTNTAADFSAGASTIKPHGAPLLTTLTFTMTDPAAFGSFTFRGQPKADEVINIAVFDENNTEFDFTTSSKSANADLSPIGIFATGSDSISKIVLFASSGWKEGKQYTVTDATGVNGSGGGSPTPEPAAWIVMIAGFGLLGTLLRRRSGALELTAA